MSMKPATKLRSAGTQRGSGSSGAFVAAGAISLIRSSFAGLCPFAVRPARSATSWRSAKSSRLESPLHAAVTPRACRQRGTFRLSARPTQWMILVFSIIVLFFVAVAAAFVRRHEHGRQTKLRTPASPPQIALKHLSRSDFYSSGDVQLGVP
jgi:hypothetical protein